MPPFVVSTGDEHESLAGSIHVPWVQEGLFPVDMNEPAPPVHGQHCGKAHSTPPKAAGAARAADVAVAASLDPSMVRQLLHGQHVELLSTGGGTVRCIAFLDRRLTALTLKRIWQNQAAGKRTVRIADVAQVIVGESGGREFGLCTHDLSVTLALKSQHAVAFTFSDPGERDDFAQCLLSLVNDAVTANKSDSGAATVAAVDNAAAG